MSALFYLDYPSGYFTQFKTYEEALASAKKNLSKRAGERVVMQAIAEVVPTTPPIEVRQMHFDPSVNMPKPTKVIQSLEDFDDDDED